MMTTGELKVCERFKEIRNSLNMKQGDFAKEIKTTQGHVSDIENKRKGVSDRVIEIICLKFGISEEWLRTGEGEMYKPVEDKLSYYVSEITDGDDEFIKDLIMAYMELDENSKQALRKIAENMLNIAKSKEQ